MSNQQESKYLAAFGKHIAELRRRHNLTQETLAEKTNLSTRTIASIEQGRRWLRLGTLHRLAKGLGISVDGLFKGQ